MIIKNEIPILEYDDASPEVIAPTHDCPDLRLPEKCLFSVSAVLWLSRILTVCLFA